MHRAAPVTLASLPLAVALWACGGSSPSPAEPTATPGHCVADPSTSQTRRPRPPEAGCSDADARAARDQACTGGDADACFQRAVCIKLQETGADMPEDERATQVATALADLRIACDAGISEACVVRVGFQMMNDEPLPADGCTDLVRSCNLGDKDGCFACTHNGCD
jgi:hypothetical protein